MDKFILLSFDIEEFDIPEEYGQKLDEETKLEISLRGTKNILNLLNKLEIKATFFITSYFAEKNKKLVKEISKKHEIGSHGHFHSSFSIEDLKKSKDKLKKIIGKRIEGFRMPKLSPIDNFEIKNAGYKYNSSLNPTYLPGRYNNFFKKRTAHYNEELLNIPVSVTPLIRFPIFWLSFKNFPLSLIEMASGITIKKDSYLNTYFHPWEFTSIHEFKIPKYIKKYSGEKMLAKLENYIIWCKKNKYNFITFSEFKEIYFPIKTVTPQRKATEETI